MTFSLARYMSLLFNINHFRWSGFHLYAAKSYLGKRYLEY